MERNVYILESDISLPEEIWGRSALTTNLYFSQVTFSRADGGNIHGLAFPPSGEGGGEG